MKKTFGIIVTLVMLAMSIASVGIAYAGSDTFISLNDFTIAYNVSALMAGTGHSMSVDNASFVIGEVNDILSITILEDTVVMQVSFPHGNEQYEINGITLIYLPDGDALSAMHYIYAIGELAMATGAIGRPDDIMDFIEDLGIMDNLSDGSNGSVIVNNIEYSYTISAYLGYWFYIKTVD